MSAKLKATLISLLLVFLTAVVGAMAAYGGSVISLGATAWKGVAAAGVAAVLFALYQLVTQWQPRDLWTDLLLVFAATALGQLVTFGTHIFDLGAGQWKGVLAAAVAATVAAAFNWLNPGHTIYGMTLLKLPGRVQKGS